MSPEPPAVWSRPSKLERGIAVTGVIVLPLTDLLLTILILVRVWQG